MRSSFETAMNAYVGFLDVFGIFLVGGTFISSGNASITETGSWSVDTLALAVTVASVLAGFVAGVVIATLLTHQRPQQPVRVLAAVTIVLAVTGVASAISSAAAVVGFLVALAAGAASTLINPDGQLVATTQDLAERVLSRHASRRLVYRMQVSVAFAVGAVMGVLTCRFFAGSGLWIALAGALAAIALSC
ncbi:DUF1275 family protein [Rhodococcus baikonurensis]|uniref:DUF1275 family protein n=1 Tax=Rhodococcus erythropolis group TaxID=2840174 RepID=UPI001552CD99|nr:DUF1275 family protein [Rhodococcus erythropolis]